jgi:phosphatidylinositol-3-phosphatase
MPSIVRRATHIVRIVAIALSLLLLVVVAAAVTPRSYLPIVISTRATPTAIATLGPSPTAAAQAGIPAFSHVFIIVMENEAYDKVLGNPDVPYINNLAQQYAVADNYYGITHPSLPNYIAATSGDTQGITSDCTNCFVDAPNIVDQLEAAGKSWKGYMESMPSPCFVGDSKPLYRQKHNPFIYFDDIRNNPARCEKIVPFTQFDADLQAGAVPDYAWITPNMCNDIHDCSLATGDAWLQTWVAKILASPAWQQNGALFLTFDESDHSDGSSCCTYAMGGHVLTLVISPLAKPAYRSQVAYDHYSLLRTIEQAWGMPLLGKAGCDCSLPMTDFFSATASARRP